MESRDRTRRGRKRSRLPIRQIIVSAWRAGLSNAGRVLLVAVAVSEGAAVVEAVLHELIDRADLPMAVIADLASTGVNLLGLVVLSGVLSQVVGEAGHGRRQASIGAILRSLPWLRLIAADIMVALLVTVGLVALVLPGLVLLTLLAVVGPVIEIEHRPAPAALRHSARLVRPHFWGVVGLATLPTLIADQIPAALPDGAGLTETLVFLAIRGIGEALVDAALGLVLVELAYRLISDSAARQREQAAEA